MALSISDAGIRLIKQFEGCRLVAYQDVAGIWTIGYGSTRIHGVPVFKGQHITYEEANAALRDDCNTFARQMTPLLPSTLVQNQVDALISLCYNIGVGNFEKSTLRKNILAGLPIEESLFTRWNKARNPNTNQLEPVAGLTRRRQIEYAYYQGAQV